MNKNPPLYDPVLIRALEGISEAITSFDKTTCFREINCEFLSDCYFDWEALCLAWSSCGSVSVAETQLMVYIGRDYISRE